MNQSEEFKMLETAINIAVMAHKGQIDLSGQPYILHPLAVMNMVDTTDEKIIAVLHDVLEDTKITSNNLYYRGISYPLIFVIERLTKNDKESNENYINNVCKCKFARKIKIADIKHNMSWDRLGQLPEEKVIKLTKKYTRSMHTLLNYKEK